MKIPPPHLPSPLGRLQAEVTDLDALKQRGWQDLHILVVCESDARLDFVERELIRRIGARLYGGQRHG